MNTAMVVHFNRLADGSYLPASYRRLDGPAEMAYDRPLLEEAMAVFLEAAARMSDLEGPAAHRGSDRDSVTHGHRELDEAPIS